MVCHPSNIGFCYVCSVRPGIEATAFWKFTGSTASYHYSDSTTGGDVATGTASPCSNTCHPNYNYRLVTCISFCPRLVVKGMVLMCTANGIVIFWCPCARSWMQNADKAVLHLFLICLFIHVHLCSLHIRAFSVLGALAQPFLFCCTSSNALGDNLSIGSVTL